MTVNHQWVLAERPDALVQENTFRWVEAPMPEPGEGEFLVRNLMLSFDPTQRGWLNDTKGYVPPVQIGEVMRAGSVGQVVKSNHPDYDEGDLVQGAFGWQEYATSNGTGMMATRKLHPGVTPNAALSIFGITGLTAYFGLLDIGEPKQGDAVLVSGAAGATGSVVGQIAKIKGCGPVVGIAGGEKKCAWLTDEANYDHAIDYKSDDVGERIREFFPKGIDIYFDNVGGPILDQALINIALNARVVLCGGISSGYGTELPPGPQFYMQLVIQRARMEGFLVLDYMDRAAEAIQELAGWVQEGRIHYLEDIAEGLENAPMTLNRLFTGANFGKQLLKIADPE